MRTKKAYLRILSRHGERSSPPSSRKLSGSAANFCLHFFFFLRTAVPGSKKAKSLEIYDW
jgi:hypothetical protein